MASIWKLWHIISSHLGFFQLLSKTYFPLKSRGIGNKAAVVPYLRNLCPKNSFYMW